MATLSEAAKKAKLQHRFLSLKDDSRTVWNQNRKVLSELVLRGNDENGIKEAKVLPGQINNVLKSLIDIKRGIIDLMMTLEK